MIDDEKIKQYREARENDVPISKAMELIGYSPKVARQGVHKLPKVLKGIEVELQSAAAEHYIALADKFDKKSYEKLIMGRMASTIAKGSDADATPAAKLAGSHKELNLWSPDSVVGVQVNVALLDQLEGVVKTPKD
jgi:hypothetical protein